MTVVLGLDDLVFTFMHKAASTKGVNIYSHVGYLNLKSNTDEFGDTFLLFGPRSTCSFLEYEEEDRVLKGWLLEYSGVKEVETEYLRIAGPVNFYCNVVRIKLVYKDAAIINLNYIFRYIEQKIRDYERLKS